MPSRRLFSIDTFRGLDMLFIMGLGPVLRSVSKLVGWPWLAEQTYHVAWDGLTLEDVIFPTFLFLAGVSWPFSLARQLEQGKSRGEIVRRVLWRVLKLVALGLVYFGLLQFKWNEVRYLSVLGRIGIAWGVAALATLYLKPRTAVVVAVSVLVGYWTVSYFYPLLTYAPGQDPFLQANSVVTHFDAWIWPGHLATNKWGTEGFFAIFGAIATAFGGVFTGWALRRTDVAEPRKSVLLLTAGAASLAIGLGALPVCPCIKNAWTSTFVLIVAGIDLVLLSFFHYVVDVRGWTGWTLFFRVIGMNSILIYMLQWCIGFRGLSQTFFGGLAGCFANPVVSQLVLDIGYVAICWSLLYFLYRKQIFFKV